MEFSPELRDRVLAGDITVSFRLWQRPRVRPGGQYQVSLGRIEVDSIELIPFAAVTPADVRQSGEPDREALRRRAAHAGPIDDDTLVYRVEFHPLVDSVGLFCAYCASIAAGCRPVPARLACPLRFRDRPAVTAVSPVNGCGTVQAAPRGASQQRGEFVVTRDHKLTSAVKTSQLAHASHHAPGRHDRARTQ